MIQRFLSAVIRFLVRILYQKILGPVLKFAAGPAAGCRFSPTCSNYFLQAVELHGPFRGSWIGICRIFRCHPWGGSGYDPVPPAHDTKGKNQNCGPHCGHHHP